MIFSRAKPAIAPLLSNCHIFSSPWQHNWRELEVLIDKVIGKPELQVPFGFFSTGWFGVQEMHI